MGVQARKIAWLPALILLAVLVGPVVCSRVHETSVFSVVLFHP